MCTMFQEEFQIGVEALESYIGRKAEAFSEADVIRLSKVYRSLKDGVIGSEYFMDKLKPSESAPADTDKQEPAADGKKRGKQEEPKQVSMDDL